jgi:FkbM family methyltransferase
MHNRCLQIIFTILNLIEKSAAYAQGKGYGTSTIKREINLTYQLLNQKPLLAIDIGGNVGEYTAELRNRSKLTEIHVFEPSKTNIDKLNKRFSEDTLISVVPFAVSEKEVKTTLFTDSFGSGLASLTQRNLSHRNIPFELQENIQTIRFENYWKNHLNQRNIDIVKIDVEGHELNVLNGFGAALKASKAVQFEFGGCNIDTKTYFQDFWYFFKDNGFEIYRITPLGLDKIIKYDESHEYFSTTNFIAINNVCN